MNRRKFLQGAVLSAAGLYVPKAFAILPSRGVIILKAPVRQKVSGPDFDPTGPGSVYAWYKADTGLTKNGSGYVSQWADNTGNGMHLVQATGTKQPQWRSGQLATYGTLIFDGVDDNMVKAWGSVYSGAITLLLVFRQVTWTSGDYIFTTNSGLIIAQTGSNQEIYATFNNINWLHYSIAINEWHIMSLVVDGANSFYKINNSGISSKVDIGVAGLSDLYYGSLMDNTYFGNIEIAESVVFSKALSESEVNSLHVGYGSKYSI